MCYITENNSGKISTDNAQKNWNNLNHTTTENVECNNQNERDNCKSPAVLAVIYCTRSKSKTDSDNDWSCYNRREKLHNLMYADNLNNCGKNEVEQAGASNAEAGIRELFNIRYAVLHRCDCKITAEESERRAKECRNLKLR